MSTTTCRKCNGTGKLTFTRVDGGRCFACAPRADTSHAIMGSPAQVAGHAALLAADAAQRDARRQRAAARRAARS